MQHSVFCFQGTKVITIPTLLCIFYIMQTYTKYEKFNWTILSSTIVIGIFVKTNLTWKYFSQATTKPRIIKNLRIAKIQRTCISVHCLCFAFHSVWVMKLNWLVSFIFCLFLISFTFDFPWAHWVMMFWGILYSWHHPYSQQAFGHWKKTFQCIWGFAKPALLLEKT